jgi:hypothetical protein
MSPSKEQQGRAVEASVAHFRRELEVSTADCLALQDAMAVGPATHCSHHHPTHLNPRLLI